jgi:hypothetical protein
MKFPLTTLALVCSIPLFSQNLQFYYDFRHSLDPKLNPKNYPSLYFEYFKGGDSGSFLIKVQNDFTGQGHNIGQHFIQASETFRFWNPKIFLALQYSGGLGIAEPGNYGYFITNAFSVGVSKPYQWKGAWFNAEVFYTYNTYARPSQDPLGSFYWGKGFFQYKIEFAGDLEIWTLNKNLGDDTTAGLSGKRFYFFGEPQIWFKLNKQFSIGSKINLYYHVLNINNIFQVYPTIAAKYKL